MDKRLWSPNGELIAPYNLRQNPRFRNTDVGAKASDKNSCLYYFYVVRHSLILIIVSKTKFCSRFLFFLGFRRQMAKNEALIDSSCLPDRPSVSHSRFCFIWIGLQK